MVEHTEQCQARALVSRWLEESNTSRAELARRSRVSKSIVTRFLAGHSLAPGNAAKILAALHPHFSEAEIDCCVDDFQLRQFTSLATHSNNTVEPLVTGDFDKFAQQARASRLLAKAYDILAAKGQGCQVEASSLFFHSEQSFGDNYLAAATAALMGTRLLSNIGDLDRADQHCTRIEAIYARRLGNLIASRVRSLRGWVLVDKGDHDTAIELFKRNLNYATESGDIEMSRDAIHMLCLAHLCLGSSMQSEAARAALETAELYGQRWLTNLRTEHADEVSYGFAHFRLGQIAAARKQRGDLLPEEIRRAQSCFGAEPSRHFVTIFKADRLLENGDTRAAVRLATQSIESNASISYAMGMARGVRIQSLALLQEARSEEALMHAVAAAALDPWSCFGTMTISQFAQDIARSLHKTLSRKAYFALLADIWARFSTKDSEFRIVGQAHVENTLHVKALIGTFPDSTPDVADR